VAAVPVGPVTGLPTGTDGYPWWNDTVFYEVFVRSFHDGDGDGIGDLNGLIAKLDYLNDGDPNTTTDLGVTGLWLMPIHPAASYHGYDVINYYAVSPDYGTLDDFKRLLAEAHQRGIRILIDFVLNHTSIEHPWFKAARDRSSEYRNWYIWSDTNPGYEGPWGQPVWHPAGTSGYYYGVFIDFMPDLNYANPAVTAQMEDVARFWLEDVGVDGFRLDGAKHLIEEEQIQENSEASHVWYQGFRTFYKGVNPQAAAVGEIWSNTEFVASYLQGDQLDLAFEFDLAASLLKSAGIRQASPFRETLQSDYEEFELHQFATFITNHDQDRVMSQLFNSVDSAKLAGALLLTAPGVPFIYYGEEIGMAGQKPDEKIRTPMQWSADKNGGFSPGTPWEPVNRDYAQKNVAGESADPNSLLSLYRSLIRLRNEHAALRVGDLSIVQTDNRFVYASLRLSKEEAVLVVVNLKNDPVGDYSLSLESSPLAAGASFYALPLLGEGQMADLIVNSSGGFDAYQPLPALPATGVLVLQLRLKP
jgi:glycosidase